MNPIGILSIHITCLFYPSSHLEHRMVQQWRVHFPEMGMFEKREVRREFFSSRSTVLTFDRRVNLINETECLHQLGLSKELRGGATSEEEIERAQTLLPEAFRDFARRKTFLLQSNSTRNLIL